MNTTKVTLHDGVVHKKIIPKTQREYETNTSFSIIRLRIFTKRKWKVSLLTWEEQKPKLFFVLLTRK